MRKFRKMKSSRRPKLTGDPVADRALKLIYDDVNELIDSVNSPQINAEINTREGKPGDIRVVKDLSYGIDRNPGVSAYFLEAKTDDGWVRQYMDRTEHSGVSRDGTIPMESFKLETKRSIKQGALSFWKSSGNFKSSSGTTSSDVYINEDVIIGKDTAKVLTVTGNTLKIGTSGTGVVLKNDSGVLKFRNEGDTDDAEILGKQLRLSIDAGAASSDYGQMGYDGASTKLWKFNGKGLHLNAAAGTDGDTCSLIIASEAGSDAWLSFYDGTTQKWNFGYDQSDSGALNFSTGTAIGTHTRMKLARNSGADGDALLYLLYNDTNYASIHVTANGVTNINTNDSDGALGHLSLQANGHVEFDNCAAGFDKLAGTFSTSGVIGDGNDSTDIDFRLGNKYELVLTNDISGSSEFINMIFPATSGNFLLVLAQDGTGNRTVASAGWVAYQSDGSTKATNAAFADGTDGAVRWAGGGAPTLTTTANKADIISMYWDADNQTCFATITQNF